MAPMKTNKKDQSSHLERTNVRLPSEMLQAIDNECKHRAGCVSRNTWIVEAIQERLLRENAINRKNGKKEEV